MARPIHRVQVTPHFTRAFRKLPRSIQEIAVQRDAWFRSDAFDPRLKTHPLKGTLKGLWAYSITHSHRLLLEFLTDTEVLYHDIGPHDIYALR